MSESLCWATVLKEYTRVFAEVDFLQILNWSLMWILVIAKSRKFNWFSDSNSEVKLIFVYQELRCFGRQRHRKLRVEIIVELTTVLGYA